MSLSSNNQQVNANVVNGEIDFSAFQFFQQFFSDNAFSRFKTPEITNRQSQSQLKIVKSAIIRIVSFNGADISLNVCESGRPLDTLDPCSPTTLTSIYNVIAKPARP